jgi:membrane associated rhomboid family serine protease
LIPLKDNMPTSRLPLVTIALILINVAVFIWQLGFPSDQYSSGTMRQLKVSESDENSLEYGAIPYRITHPGKDCFVTGKSGGGGIDEGDTKIACEGTKDAREAEGSGAPRGDLDEAPWWATILTSMFMHGGLLHIGFNMLFLWIFGNNVEDSMGRFRYLIFYLLAGAAAVYAQAGIDPNSTIPTIGASGAIAGVLGAYALLYPRARVLTLLLIIFFVTLIEIPALVLLGIWFILQFLPAVGQVATPEIGGEGGVAYFAHVGGFIFGLALVKLFATRHREVTEHHLA